MKIAVEGCCHGELEKIYETIEEIKTRQGIEIDLLLCCGDFQAVRNQNDLQSMSVPPKYRSMQSFHKYYSGEKTAPVLTVFIGGNHEAADYLWELPFGGWVAKNIYYLGYAGVINIGGVRIGGLSGIYKSQDYNKGHFECPPFNESTKRSFYHVRSIDVFKAKLINSKVDIFMSHDWPNGIHDYGDLERLLRFKRFLADDIRSGELGSAPAMEILKDIQPSYWFSAHLHVKFAARFQHPLSENGEVRETKFLSLDKCLPKRDFLQVVDVGESTGPFELHYDAEWLAISQRVNDLYNTSPRHNWLPLDKEEIDKYLPTEFEINSLRNNSSDDLKVPDNFTQTAPVYDTSSSRNGPPAEYQINPQTESFCKAYNLTNPSLPKNKRVNEFKRKFDSAEVNKNVSKVTVVEAESEDEFKELVTAKENPDEIQLDSSDESEEEKPKATNENVE